LAGTDLLAPVEKSGKPDQEALSLPPEKREGLAPWLALFLTITVYLIPLMSTVRFVRDADIWWHLAIGQWIVEHGTVPTTDPLSIHGQGQHWIAYSWLYEVTVYELYHWLGLLGIVVYRAVFGITIVASLFWLIASREPRFFISTCLTGVCSYTMIALMTERPWLISIVFAIFTLKVILDLRDGRRPWYIWLLPLIYLVWANAHIQFVYGFFLLASNQGHKSERRRRSNRHTTGILALVDTGWSHCTFCVGHAYQSVWFWAVSSYLGVCHSESRSGIDPGNDGPGISPHVGMDCFGAGAIDSFSSGPDEKIVQL